MWLQFVNGHPAYLWVNHTSFTSMRKFAEFNDISDNWVNFNKNVTLSIAVGTCALISSASYLILTWSSWSLSILSCLAHWWRSISLIFDSWLTVLNLQLAILTEYLVTTLAFKWHVWKTTAADTLNLLNQFLLKFVLNFLFFDVNWWNGIRAHNLIDNSVRENEVKLVWLRILLLLKLDRARVLNWCLLISIWLTSHTWCLLSKRGSWLWNNLRLTSILILWHKLRCKVLLLSLGWPHAASSRTYTCRRCWSHWTQTTLISVGLVSTTSCHFIGAAVPGCNWCASEILPWSLCKAITRWLSKLTCCLVLWGKLLLRWLFANPDRVSWRSWSHWSRSEIVVNLLWIADLLLLLLVPLLWGALKATRSSWSASATAL